MGKVLGVAMIVKNEEALLARCLDSVKGVDEIVICDTGSTDGTVEIAKGYTAKVHTDFTWCDHFAKARNHAKNKSTADWILSIDADEQLTCPLDNVRQAIEQAWLAIDCKLYAEDNGQMHYFPRLFKNSPQVHWEGAIHNHLSVLGEQVGDVRITYGYSPAHYLDKDRAMRILEKEVTDHGGLREMFYLGREKYYRRLYKEAMDLLWKYTQSPNCRHVAEKAEAYILMARIAMAEGQMDAARDACVQALTLNANFKEAALIMADLAGPGRGVTRWDKNSEQWRKMAESADNYDVLFIRK